MPMRLLKRCRDALTIDKRDIIDAAAALQKNEKMRSFSATKL
jgi:hypothetical protein